MTIREWSERYLYDRGMFPEDAAAVVAACAASNLGGAMSGRWDDSIDVYPGGMDRLGPVLAIGLDAAALGWIDANRPGAWFRAIFAGGEPR